MEGVSGTQITSTILQSHPAKTDTEGAVRINGISVLSGLNFEKMLRALSPGTQSAVRNNEVSRKRGLTVLFLSGVKRV